MMASRRDRYLRQHDVVMNQPPRHWWLGAPMGNGRMGGMVYFPGHFEILLNKLDIWTCRPSKSTLSPHRRILGLLKQGDWNRLLALEQEKGAGESLPKPGGSFRLYDQATGKPADLTHYCQRLSLGAGQLTTAFATSSSKTSINTFYDMDSNVLCLRIRDSHLAGKMIELARAEEPGLGKRAFNHDASTLWIDYRFADGFRYVLALAVDASIIRMTRERNRLRAVFNRRAPDQLDLFLTIVTSRESDDPVAQAKIIRDQAGRDGFRRKRAVSRDWWRDFWKKSLIELPDKLIENLWFYHLYQLACISRDTVAPGLYGHWFKDEAMWGGAYVGDINLAMTYWPIFTANHLELGAPYFKTLMDARPAMQRETCALFGLPGIKAPCYMTPYIQSEMCANPCRYIMSTTPMYAQLFWWHYACSGDKEFLRTTGYPFLKDTLTFLTHYATRGKDGAYHIVPSFSPEQGPLMAKDPAIDIAYLRYMLKITIKASMILGVDADERRKWKRVLAQVAEYPIVNDIMADTRRSVEQDAREMSGNDQATVVHIRHPALYTCLYPVKEAGLHKPSARLFKVMERTFDLRFQQPGVYDRIENHNSFGWTWYACLAAHLGRGDKALELIYDRGISCQLLPNGMFVQQRNDPIRDTAEPFLLTDGCSGFVTAVNEMLLQSVEGHILVFPALPSSWRDCHFEDLLAEGAFEITACRQQGTTRYIRIRSRAGNACRMVNPWKDAALIVEDESNSKRILRTADRVIRFITRPGGVYLVYRTGARVDPVHPLPSVKRRNAPRRFIWRSGTLGW